MFGSEVERYRWHARGRDLLSAICVSVLFTCIVEAMAYLFLHDANERVNPHFAAELNDWVTGPASTPPLCRWDSIWYVNIATGPYPGTSGESTHNAAFFPFFSLVTRLVMKGTGLSAAYAAIWQNRLCLPATIFLLRDFVRLRGGDVATSWAAVAALLFAPNGFLLVSGMADPFFLFLTLLTVVLALRDRPWLATIPAFAAGVTRVHAFAFIVGLVAMAVTAGAGKRARRFAPAAACTLGVASMMAYFAYTSHDPLLFIHEQSYFGKGTFDPLESMKELPLYADLWPPSTFADFLVWARLPAAVAVVSSAAWFVARARWFEAAYTAALYAMILLSTHWGLPRYMVMIFPIPVALATLHRWRSVWLGFLLVNAMIEGYLLLQYVMLRPGV